MSARDELLREMTHNHLYMDDERANELIDAYAHELAEKIREAAAGSPPDGLCPKVSTAKGAARLIDPEYGRGE